jgi:hypothetical protein
MTSEYIRRGIALLALAIAVASVYVVYERTRACARPIAYTVGTIDPRFGLNKEAFTVHLKKAATLWNTAAGKELFVYDPEGSLPVHLIFDERQQTANLGKEIQNEQKLHNARSAELSLARSAYESDARAYEEEVRYWNARGGAPKNVYQSLEQKRLALMATQDRLNAEVAALNADVRALNQDVAAYNADAGGTFEQGAYHADRFEHYIHVYEFANETQLVRLVAHEFGHALGLDHAVDPKAIMHPLNTGTSLALSAEDKASLTALCGLK